MDDEDLRRIIEDIELQLDNATERAHKHSVPLEFLGSKTFTKDELYSVWAQGRKDAYRFVLTNLRAARGY